MAVDDEQDAFKIPILVFCRKHRSSSSSLFSFLFFFFFFILFFPLPSYFLDFPHIETRCYQQSSINIPVRSDYSFSFYFHFLFSIFWLLVSSLCAGHSTFLQHSFICSSFHSETEYLISFWCVSEHDYLSFKRRIIEETMRQKIIRNSENHH